VPLRRDTEEVKRTSRIAAARAAGRMQELSLPLPLSTPLFLSPFYPLFLSPFYLLLSARSDNAELQLLNLASYSCLVCPPCFCAS